MLLSAERSVHNSGRTRLIMGTVGVAIGAGFALFAVASKRRTTPTQAKQQRDHRFPRVTNVLGVMGAVLVVLLIPVLTTLGILLVVAAISGQPPKDDGAATTASAGLHPARDNVPGHHNSLWTHGPTVNVPASASS
jgi:hypothetical protein